MKKRACLSMAMLLALAPLALSQSLQIPPASAGNFDECFNSEGDGIRCCDGQRAGSWITGDSDCVKDVSLTDGPGGQVNLSTGSYHTHLVDYRVQFNQGEECGRAPIVETPHHPPFVLEFSRFFRTRAAYVDFGLTKGWVDNYFFQLNISTGQGFRSARLEVPSGAAANWVDPNPADTWLADDPDQQSMHLSLVDQAGDQHLVTDRWGGKYHFIPEPGLRSSVQYLCDWLEDNNGNRITLAYSNSYPATATDGFGRSLIYTWSATTFNGTRHLISVLLPDGNQVRLRYFFDNQRAYEVTYANGANGDVASYGRGTDADGNFYYFNDPLGEAGGRKDRVYTYYVSTFDTGRVRGVKDESGHVQYTRSEAPVGPAITIEYDDGRKFQYDCAFAGLNRTLTNLRSGAVVQKSWQPNGGLLKSNIDALGRWTTYDHDDARALETRKTYPDGSSETRSYNALNRVVDQVDRNGNLTHHDYDANGNLTRRTHADASFEQWTRLSSGRVSAYRDQNGNTTTYQYDARGNVNRITLPADIAETNPVTTYVYDVNGRVLSRLDPVGLLTSYQYDALGRRVGTTHPDTTTELVAYGTPDLPSSTDPVDTAGLVVARTDRNGNVTSYEHGANDRLLRVAGAPGETVYSYDARDRLVARTDNGDVESYGYDSGYRRTALTRAANASTALTSAYQYDLLDRVVLETDPHGFTTATIHDNVARVALIVRQIDGLTSAGTSYTHDPNGNVLGEIDPLGHARSFVYDSNDRLLRAYDPPPFAANFVGYSHDSSGNLLSRSDQEGNTTYYTYTPRNQLKSEMDPTGNMILRKYYLDDNLKEILNLGTGAKKTFGYACCSRPSSETTLVDGGAADMTNGSAYDGNGNVVQATDGEGNLWQYQYDARNRLVRKTDPLGEQTQTAYFDDGSPFDNRLASGQGSAVSVTDANGRTTTRVLDGLGRLFSEIDAVGHRTLHAYDVLSAGTVESSRTDREGHISREYRDGLGQLVRSLDALNLQTRRFYDQGGNLRRIAPNGGAPTFAYDELDRLTLETYPDLGEVRTTYFRNGRVKTRKDPVGDTTTYAYDAAGRRLSAQYQDASIDAFVYDAGGRMVHATSGLYGNDVALFYDKADRVVREVSTRPVLIGYDRRSLKTRITSPEGIVFQKTYTARGELDTVKRNATVYADHTYDAAGRLIRKTLANGTTNSWTYDARNWIRGIDIDRGAEDLLSLRYSYDDEGHKRTQHNATRITRSEAYGYDAAYRLVSYAGRLPPVRLADPSVIIDLKGIVKSQTWTLDDLGNWRVFSVNGVPQYRSHNLSNEITQIDATLLDHDKNGNLLDDGTFEYVYDFNNRLKQILRKSDDSLIAEYNYDALGRRISKNAIDKSVVALKRFIYYYDGEQIVEMREKPTVEDPDVFAAAFAYGSYIDEPLVMLRAVGSILYYHQNSQHSVVVLTNSAGSLLERYEYDPYGETRVFDPDWEDPSDFSGVGNIFTFQGRQADYEAGLVHFRSRTLSPLLGRFQQRDPEDYADGLNLYAAYFVPNALDPFGTTRMVAAAASPAGPPGRACNCGNN